MDGIGGSGRPHTTDLMVRELCEKGIDHPTGWEMHARYRKIEK